MWTRSYLDFVRSRAFYVATIIADEFLLGNNLRHFSNNIFVVTRVSNSLREKSSSWTIDERD